MFSSGFQRKANLPRSPRIGALGVLAVFLALGTIRSEGDTTVYAWGKYYFGNGYVSMSAPSGMSNVVAVASGSDHILALRRDGTVVAWGSCWFPWGFVLPTVPAGLSNVVAISAGEGQSLALRSDGTVVAWNALNLQAVPAAVTNVVAIAAGGYATEHNLAVRLDGSVVAWGHNASGQATVPAGLSNVVAAAAGAYHSLALRADGTVVGWGDNAFGQTNVPAGLSNAVALAAGKVFANLALKEDGTAAPWGNIYDGFGYVPLTLPGALTDIVAVSVGNYHAIALHSNGDIVTWGNYHDGFGYYPMPSPPGLHSVVAISSGGNHAATLSGSMSPFIQTPMLDQIVVVGSSPVFRVKVAGTRPYSFQWRKDGNNLPGATDGVLTLNSVTLNETGEYSIVVSNSVGATTSPAATLTVVPFIISTQPQDQIAIIGGPAQFSVICQSVLPLFYQWRFGDADLPGQTNSVLNLSGVTAQQAGNYSVIVSNSAGAIVSSNALLTTVPLIITDQPASQAIVLSNTATFTVTCQSFLPLTYQWRLNDVALPGATSNPLIIPSVGWNDRGNYSVVISNNAGSRDSSNALLRLSRRATTINSWGLSNSFTIAPAGFTNATALAAGQNHALALWADGSVGTWGNTNYGQTTLPAPVSNVLMVAAGLDHSLALRSDRTVIAWGKNDYGQATAPAGLNDVIAIAAGANHNLVLHLNGTVSSWGDNSSTQTNTPAGLSNVVAVAVGTNHNLALRANGSVVAWGGNGLGQTNVPSGLGNVVAVAAGAAHSLALRADGTVVAWGNFHGGRSWVPATVPTGLSNVVAIASGLLHCLALRADGTVTAWGWNGNGQTNVPAGLINTLSVYAGGVRSLALVGDSALIDRVSAENPTYNATGFALQIPTRCGHVYRLEYKEGFENSTWSALPLVPGVGATQTLTDPSIANQRFYRIREW